MRQRAGKVLGASSPRGRMALGGAGLCQQPAGTPGPVQGTLSPELWPSVDALPHSCQNGLQGTFSRHSRAGVLKFGDLSY